VSPTSAFLWCFSLLQLRRIKKLRIFNGLSSSIPTAPKGVNFFDPKHKKSAHETREEDKEREKLRSLCLPQETNEHSRRHTAARPAAELLGDQQAAGG